MSFIVSEGSSHDHNSCNSGWRDFFFYSTGILALWLSHCNHFSFLLKSKRLDVITLTCSCLAAAVLLVNMGDFQQYEQDFYQTGYHVDDQGQSFAYYDTDNPTCAAYYEWVASGSSEHKICSQSHLNVAELFWMLLFDCISENVDCFAHSFSIKVIIVKNNNLCSQHVWMNKKFYLSWLQNW